MAFLAQSFNILVDLLLTLILIRVVLSWVPRARGQITDFIEECTNPILKPFQRIIPTPSGIDFSPMIAMLTLELLRNFINGFL